jgi:hypothetical protein
MSDDEIDRQQRQSLIPLFDKGSYRLRLKIPPLSILWNCDGRSEGIYTGVACSNITWITAVANLGQPDFIDKTIRL